MDDDCQQNAVPDGRARAERIRDIADEYLRSWADGEPDSVESILDAHEDLLPELEDELRKARVIAMAGGLDVRETLLGGGSSSEPARRDSCDIQRPTGPLVSSLESPDGMAAAGDTAPDRFGCYDVIKVLGQGVAARGAAEHESSKQIFAFQLFDAVQSASAGQHNLSPCEKCWEETSLPCYLHAKGLEPSGKFQQFCPN